MRTVFQNTIDRAIVRGLSQVGSFLCPEDAMREHVSITVVPPPSRSEFEESVRHLDTQGLIINGDVITGRGWKLTEMGRVWARENRVA